MNEPTIFEMTLAGDADIAVGKGLTVYTDSFKLGDANEFALVYIQAATGIPNIRIEMEQGRVSPATENAADVNFGVPKNAGTIETALTSKAVQMTQLTPIALNFIRFKITDNDTGPTDTVVNMWLSTQKKFTQ